ncbi:PSP1 domain-containing protein [Bergeyella sp. RCAD1439]|uniref:PSP1 domain-containing protein n=1 Tax=Bergeyella anatis TaxID=3113737 RepID=UPI002E177664|nr:regulatory iron-sulfur-containing complex subunit RicT [Bergeyella sp. RCAD1439]
MSCGCKTSGDHSCGTKSSTGCGSVDTCGNSYKLSVFDWLSNVNTPNHKTSCDFVEVRFKNDRKHFYRNPHHLPLHIGSIVTVESSPGHDVGVVSLTGELVKIQMKKKKASQDQALKIYRIANQKDIETWQEARKKEDATKKEAKIIASRLGLEMKITDVEYQGDGAKATFYYTADSRVDFRQLIKEYATLFKTKIDMKQIGFRQESAKIGGIGSCGRELCCSSWLTDFRSVNTNAARYQQLSINPQKLAGQCGKLKCCLNFELDSYMDALSDFPSQNTSLDTEKGKAFCIKIDVFKKKMWFAYAENPVAWYDIDTKEVKKQIENNKKGIKAPLLEELVTPNEFAMKTVDLIQENSTDRFDKKNKPRNRKSNSKNQRDHKTKEQNQTKNQTKEKPAEKRTENTAKPKPRKNFKKKPPKNNPNE